jgi:hypothetical protein
VPTRRTPPFGLTGFGFGAGLARGRGAASRAPSAPIYTALRAAAFVRKVPERARGCGRFQPGLLPKVEESQLVEGDRPERL